MTQLHILQRKFGYLKKPGDHLVEGVSNGFVRISTNDYFYPEDILNLKTGERYKSKYYNAGRSPPYSKMFEVSKRLNGIPYVVTIGRNGEYYLRSGTYKVAEIDVESGKLEKKTWSKLDRSIEYAQWLHRNSKKPELI